MDTKEEDKKEFVAKNIENEQVKAREENKKLNNIDTKIEDSNNKKTAEKQEPKDAKNETNKNNEAKTKNKFFNKSNFIQFLKFTGFSLSAGAIQIGSFEIMYDLIAWKQWWATYLISVILSVIWNFTFNRKFTFKSASNIPVAMSFALLFYVFFVPVSVLGGNALEGIGWNGTLVTVIMMLFNFVLEYLWDKFLVFNDKIMGKITTKKVKKTK